MKTLPLSFILCVFYFHICAVCPAKAPEEKSFLHVINNTTFDVEEVVRWTCGYLDIRNITICITPQTRYFKEEGFVIKQGDIYYIYLKKKVSNLKLILIHELIHVKQYESKQLTKIGRTRVSFKGNIIDLTRKEYGRRSFEAEAHANDSRILGEYYRHLRSLRAEFNAKDKNDNI